MKILMFGNTASVNYAITKELRKRGHIVKIVGDKSLIVSGKYDYGMRWKDILKRGFGNTDYDIIHISSPNIKKVLLLIRYLWNTKAIVTHWRGSDLRLWWKSFPIRKLMFHLSKMNLYSTMDLHFWLRKISRNNKMFFRSCVDTDLFKPMNVDKKKKLLEMDKREKRTIPHKDMPQFFNQYEEIISHNYQADDHIPSVTVMEAVACGLKSFYHPWMTRKWVIENASVQKQTDKLLEVYRNCLKK